jgi:hypothetical protein
MEAVIVYDILRGAQGEEIVKEVSMAAAVVIETFHFKSPYHMRLHGSTENGLSWDDVSLIIISYETL